MGDLHASVDAFCMGLPSTCGLPNLDAQVCMGACHDMPLPDQWDGLGLNDRDIYVAVC